jgi:hypothetical protein
LSYRPKTANYSKLDSTLASFDTEAVSKGNSARTWERTSVANLLRHSQNRRYYARFVVSGKQKWLSLNPDVLGVAKLRIADEVKKIRRQRKARDAIESGTGMMGDLLTVYKEGLKSRAGLDPKPASEGASIAHTAPKSGPGLSRLSLTKSHARRLRIGAIGH